MKKNVIVSLADANYFPLLEELVDSIKRFKEQRKYSNLHFRCRIRPRIKKKNYQKKLMKLNLQNGILKFLNLKLKEKNG